MHIYKQIISLTLLFSVSFGSISFAQSNNSQIVMTKAELEAFLAKIAQAKKAQLDRQYTITQKNNAIDDSLVYLIRQSQDNYDKDRRIYDAIDRLNNRIDLLMLNQGKGATVYSQSQTVDRGYTSTTHIIETSAQPNNPVVVQSTAAAPNKNTVDIDRLQRQIANLEAQVSRLSNVNTTTQTAENTDEVRALQAKIDELKTLLYQKNTRVDTVTKVVVNNIPAPKEYIHDTIGKNNIFADYKHTIYFANNSAKIASQETAALVQTVNMIKNKGNKATVVLRSFASNKGSVQYNNTLSFKRAKAVKNELIKLGLNADEIVILNNGIDKKSSPEKARRVDITLLDY